MKDKKTYLSIVTAIIIALFLVNCSSTNVSTNIIEIIKDGNYRILKTEQIDSEGNTTIENYSYNENNQILLYEMTFNNDIVRKTVNTYDDGKLIKKAHIEYDDSKEINYTYDEKGNLAKEEWKGNEGYGYMVYKYDEKGRMIFRESINFTEYIIDDEYYSSKYFYDDEDRLIKQVSIESHGIEMTHELNYNKQGLLTEESYYHTSGYKSKKTYAYDKDGNVLSKKEHGNDGFVFNEYYKYKNGFLIETSFEFYVEGNESIYSATSKEEYYYNNNGLLIKKVSKVISKSSVLGNTEENTIETYKYDENGNLIEKIVNANNEKITTKYYYEKY